MFVILGVLHRNQRIHRLNIYGVVMDKMVDRVFSVVKLSQETAVGVVGAMVVGAVVMQFVVVERKPER